VKLTIWSLSSKSIFYIRNPKNLKKSVEYNRQVLIFFCPWFLSVDEYYASIIYAFVTLCLFFHG